MLGLKQTNEPKHLLVHPTKHLLGFTRRAEEQGHPLPDKREPWSQNVFFFYGPLCDHCSWSLFTGALNQTNI